MTVFHEAAISDEKELFQVILNYAKENITREEGVKLFVATDSEGRTVFHVAAGSYEIEKFQGIW